MSISCFTGESFMDVSFPLVVSNISLLMNFRLPLRSTSSLGEALLPSSFFSSSYSGCFIRDFERTN